MKNIQSCSLCSISITPHVMLLYMLSVCEHEKVKDIVVILRRERCFIYCNQRSRVGV